MLYFNTNLGATLSGLEQQVLYATKSLRHPRFGRYLRQWAVRTHQQHPVSCSYNLVVNEGQKNGARSQLRHQEPWPQRDRDRIVRTT